MSHYNSQKLTQSRKQSLEDQEWVTAADRDSQSLELCLLLLILYQKFLVSVSMSVSDFVIFLCFFIRLFLLCFFCYLDMSHLIKALDFLESWVLLLKLFSDLEWEFYSRSFLHSELRFSQSFQKSLCQASLSVIKLNAVSEIMSFCLLQWLILDLLVIVLSAEHVNLSLWIKLTKCFTLSIFSTLSTVLWHSLTVWSAI